MQGKQLKNIILFNAALSLINIILFAKPFLNLDLSGKNAVSTAFGVMVIVMTVIVFFYGNYRLLQPKKQPALPQLKEKDIQTLDECAAGVLFYINNNVKTYADNLNDVLQQISRMQRKEAALQLTLKERFDESELSYHKFQGAVDSMEEIMILNIKSLLNRINAFDEEEYEELMVKQRMKGTNISDSDRKILVSRQSIYEEYMAFVERSVANNEELLIRLDKLMLEISKLSEIAANDVEEMDAMKEIDKLINDTKWYK